MLKQGNDENGKLASDTLRNISTTEGLGQSQDSFADVGRMSDDDDESDDEEDEAEADMNEAEKQKKAMHLSIDITKREDFCICQALSALVLSFSIKIELMQKSDPQYFFRQLEKVGYLFACECLLSTHKPEQGMLEDYMISMRSLQNVKFRMSNEKAAITDEETWKQKELLTSLRAELAAMPGTSEEYAKKFKLASDIVETLQDASNETKQKIWYYMDDAGNEQGPFSTSEMRGWYPTYIIDETIVRRSDEATSMHSSVSERFPNGNPFPNLVWLL